MKRTASVVPSTTVTVGNPEAAIVFSGFQAGSTVLFAIYHPGDSTYFLHQPGTKADQNGAGSFPLYPAGGPSFFSGEGTYRVEVDGWDYSKSPPKYSTGPTLNFTVQR